MSQRTKEAIDQWISDESKGARYFALRSLATDTDLLDEFYLVPKIHWEMMDYDKFMINVLALAKIRELRRIAYK